MMTWRNTLLSGVVLASTLAGVSMADENLGAAATVARWNFDVLLNGKDIGEHRFELLDSGADVRIRSTASFDVKVLFFNAYRYRHQSVEEWQDGCLASLQATTDRNGDEITVTAVSESDGIVVDGKSGRQTIDNTCVMSFAYWNPAILKQQSLLNSQTGAYQAINVRYVGVETIEAVGQSFAADRYEVDTGQGVIKLWYQQDNARWLALEAPAKGNRTISYRLRDVPTLADSRIDVAAGGQRNDI